MDITWTRGRFKCRHIWIGAWVVVLKGVQQVHSLRRGENAGRVETQELYAVGQLWSFGSFNE